MEHRIEFSLNLEDYQAFAQNAMARHMRSRRGKWEAFACWVMGIVVIPAALIMYFTAETQVDYIPPSVIIAIPVCFIGWVLWHRRSYARRSVRKALRSPSGKRMLASQTVVVAPDEFHYRGSWGEVLLKWNAVAEIEVVERAIYFFVSEDSAVIVPEHAFPNHDDYREFMHAAQRYHDPGDGPRRPCPECGYDLRSVAEFGCPECGWKREG